MDADTSTPRRTMIARAGFWLTVASPAAEHRAPANDNAPVPPSAATTPPDSSPRVG